MTLSFCNKLVLGILALGIFTGTPLFAEATKAPTIELKNFPDTSVPEAAYKTVEKSYRFDTAGTCEFRCKSELRVNTLAAMNELCGETFLVYNPRFQNIKINAAYTIMADGTRVETPTNAFNTVLPKCAADAPAFNFLKELIITHTALEPGATIVLDYSIFYANAHQLLFDEYPDMPFPCERLVFNFNGSTTEHFNVPARSREAFFKAKQTVPVIYPGMPNPTPRDFGNMENVSLGERGKKLLPTLINDAMTRREKIAAVVEFVRKRVATVKIPSELLQASDLRSPDNVIASAYGTPLEKAHLLWCLLKEIGESGNLIYNDRNDTFFEELSTFNNMRISVEASESEPCSLQSQTAITLTRKRAQFQGEITVPVLARDIAQSAKNWLGVSEKDFEASRTFADARARFSYSQALLPEDGVLVWRVPVSPKGIAALSLDKLPRERESELVLPGMLSAHQESYEYTLRLDDAWELLEKARNTEIKNAVGAVSFVIERDGNIARIRKSLQLNTMRIPAEYYGDLRELMVAWHAPENNRLLLRSREP